MSATRRETAKANLDSNVDRGTPKSCLQPLVLLSGFNKHICRKHENEVYGPREHQDSPPHREFCIEKRISSASVLADTFAIDNVSR